jgi:hypothetical protein
MPLTPLMGRSAPRPHRPRNSTAESPRPMSARACSTCATVKDGRRPKANSALFRCLDTCPRPLDDQAALELGQSAHDVMTRRPPELAVSMGSDKLRKLTPRAPSSAMSVTR